MLAARTWRLSSLPLAAMHIALRKALKIGTQSITFIVFQPPCLPSPTNFFPLGLFLWYFCEYPLTYNLSYIKWNVRFDLFIFFLFYFVTPRVVHWVYGTKVRRSCSHENYIEHPRGKKAPYKKYIFSVLVD